MAEAKGFEKLKAYLFEDRWTSYLAITAGLLMVVLIGASFAHKTAVWQVNQIIKGEVTHKKLECKTVADAEKLKYLNEQRAEIVEYSKSHRAAAIKFYGYFYATFTIFSIFGALAAISLAVIAKKGLDKAGNHLMTVFLVSTAIVILYQSFFGVFQQTKNIDSNGLLSIAYARLADEIDTYCVTGRVNAKDPKQVLAETLGKPTPAQPKNTNEKPANTPGGNTGNTQSSNTGNTEGVKSPEPTPTPAPTQKISPFFVHLDQDEFINYVNWEMARLKDFSVKFDETKFASFDPKRFSVTP